MVRLAVGFLAFVVIFFLPGCSGGTCTVQGEVKYEDEAVKDGEINFVPEDGKGPSGGAPIKDGQFRLAGLLTPGKYKVRFSGKRLIPAPKGVPLPANIKPGDPMPVDGLIPDKAVGNHQIVDIRADTGRLTFELKKPAKS